MILGLTGSPGLHLWTSFNPTGYLESIRWFGSTAIYSLYAPTAPGYLSMIIFHLAVSIQMLNLQPPTKNTEAISTPILTCTLNMEIVGSSVSNGEYGEGGKW